MSAPMELSIGEVRQNPTGTVVPEDIQQVFTRIHAQVVEATKGYTTNAPPLPATAPTLTPESLQSTFDTLLAAFHASQHQLQIESLRSAHFSRETKQLESFMTQQILPGMTQKTAQLRSTFQDPALAAVITHTLQRQHEAERILNEKEHKFLADTYRGESVLGRKILAKANSLATENKEFEQRTERDLQPMRQQLHHLETELANEKRKNEEMTQMVHETTEFYTELEGDHEKAIARIAKLEKQLEK